MILLNVLPDCRIETTVGCGFGGCASINSLTFKIQDTLCFQSHNGTGTPARTSFLMASSLLHQEALIKRHLHNCLPCSTVASEHALALTWVYARETSILNQHGSSLTRGQRYASKIVANADERRFLADLSSGWAE